MDYAKSSDWEIGAVIERHEWVEGREIGYQRSDIGVGTGSNSISPLRLSPRGCKVTCVKDGIPRLFGFRNVRSYGTWLQLVCCAGLVVRPYISEYPEVG